MDKKSTTTERKSYTPPGRSNNLLRRFQNKMGSVLGEDSSRGPLEHPGVPRSHKHPGTESGYLCSEGVHEGPEQQVDLNRSSLSEQQGRNPLPSATSLDNGDIEVVRNKTPLSSSSICSREEQCGGRQGGSQNERQQRLEDRFDCHPALNQEVSNRSFRVSPDTSTGQIRQLAARSGCDPRGRVHNELEKFDSVRISTISLIPAVLHKTKKEMATLALIAPYGRLNHGGLC